MSTQKDAVEVSEVRLKLVGAERFVDLKVSPDAILRDQVVTVDPEKAEELLDLVYMDIRNNENPMFIEYDPEKEEAEKKAKAARSARRTRRA